MSKTFYEAIEMPDPTFELILQIMMVGRGDDQFEIDKERCFLSVVNHILNHYISREDTSLKIPVIYFPICNENSQELCEEFVALKLGFFSNPENLNNILYRLNILKQRGLFIRSDEHTSELQRRARAYFRYQMKLLDILKKVTNNIPNTTSKIYSNYLTTSFNQYCAAYGHHNRKIINRYWYLARTIEKNSSLSLITETPDDFYHLMTHIGDQNNRSIENLVFFPCNSPDGDYSKFCADIIQKAYFEDFVNAHTGLRNTFIFRFSRKPYRLRRLLDVNNMMKERIGIHANDDSYDFISFKYDEASLLFNQDKPSICNLTIGGGHDDTRQAFEQLFNDTIDSLDGKYILRRNEIAMCVTEEMKNRAAEILSSEAEIDETILSQIFTINRELWEQHSTMLTNFLNGHDVCVVVGNNIDNVLMCHFRDWLAQHYNVNSVQIATFGDLKGKLARNGKYQNDIQCKRIIVLSFRNDYTESIFHKYPNSFDPICINEDQKAIVISNLFILRPYYDWGHYNYIKAIKKILQSQFRTEEMSLVVNAMERPHNEPSEDFYDEDNDRNYRQVPQATVCYSDGSKRSINKSEWILYQYKDDERAILPLSDIADLYSDSVEGLSIQPISSLINIITNNYLETKKAEDSKSEKLFKEQAAYALTEEQRASNIQLWKILLQRRINERTIEVVFNEIMSPFSREQRISFNAFTQWPNEDYGLPRSNKMQEYLIRNYLGIKDPYLRVVRRLKAKSRNNTEFINANVRHFLSISLLSNDYAKIYNSLNDEMRDLLSLGSAEDVKALKELVSENIQLESINSINL